MGECGISLNNIEKIRRKRHMTQEQLAIKTGISQSTISNMEKNSTDAVSLEKISKIANVLGVCPLTLFSCKCKDVCANCKKCYNKKNKKNINEKTKE